MKLLIKKLLKKTGLYFPILFIYHGIKSSIKKAKYRKQYRKYKGSGYCCNVCGAAYQKFVPDHPVIENKDAIRKHQVIAGYGENIFCPNCLSTARERLVIAYLSDGIKISGKKILQLAPEKNVYQLIEQKADVTTADLSPSLYKNVDRKIQKQDATRFTYEDNKFDLVIANHILEHIPQDRKAMTEIFRVLKPGGLAILQVPYSETLLCTLEDPAVNDPQKQSAWFGQSDHVRIYSLADYIDRLRTTGFSVELITEGQLNQYAQFATQPSENIFRIIKPV